MPEKCTSLVHVGNTLDLGCEIGPTGTRVGLTCHVAGVGCTDTASIADATHFLFR